MKEIYWKLLVFIFYYIRPLFVDNLDRNEDFYCMECCKPVLRRYLFCSEKCSNSQGF